MKRSILLVLGVLLAPVTAGADPIRIVDTGPGPTGLPAVSLYRGQWIAAEFEVRDPSVITGVEGWMQVAGAGNLGLSLYTDGGEVPGSRLFFQSGFIPSGEAAWRGLLDLNWAVAPGTYWVAFEVFGNTGLSGNMPFPSERPLGNEAAAHDDSRFRYFEADDIDIGVRVFADTAPVPEPASLLLLGTGLAGLAVRRRASR